MYRSLISYLFILFFTQAALFAQQENLTLRKVSVDTISPQQIMLNWQLNSFADSVTIYRCTQQCNLENNYHSVDKVKMENTNLEWIDTTANPLIQYYYSIGWRESGKTAPQNNITLQATPAITGCLNATSLYWNPYINMMDSLDYYVILYRKKDTNTAFGSLDTIQGEHYTGYYYQPYNKVSYHAQYLDNNTVYEFVIQAVSKNRSVYSFSNIAEFETGFDYDYSVNMDVSSVSVVDDRYFEIEIHTDNFPKQFQKMYLYKEGPLKTDAELLFNDNPIDSADYSPSNIYKFKDENVDPHAGLYGYQAIVYHNCKIPDTSNMLTNIYLSGERMDKYQDSIRFHRTGIPDIDPTERYELYRIVKEENITVNSNLSIKHNKCLVDVEPFLKDGVVLMYQIESENNDLSNTLTIEHEPFIHFVNAFSPKSARPEDQTFYPIILFPSDDEYLFVIYDRWGKEVFRSDKPPVYEDFTNLQGRWDGKDQQGRECPYGIYAFKISYRYNEGTRRYSEAGSVLLIR